MTSKAIAIKRKAGELERFPEFPPREDMQNWRYLYRKAVTTTLMIYYADDPDAIVANEVPIALRLPSVRGYRIPDLMVIFGADLELMEEQAGFEIERQGKGPDFVLEVASPTTGVVDYTDKRRDYERFRAFEYWRFDPSGGRYHDAALAGDRLVGGRYAPIAIDMTDDGGFRGYSEALGLYLCWEDGELRFHDPATRGYLRTHMEDAALIVEQADTIVEQADRIAELEAELRRMRG